MLISRGFAEHAKTELSPALELSQINDLKPAALRLIEATKAKIIPVVPKKKVMTPSEDRIADRAKVAKQVAEHKAKATADLLSVMTDSQEEIKIHLTQAKHVGAHIPKVNKRVYNMMTHAIKSLTINN